MKKAKHKIYFARVFWDDKSVWLGMVSVIVLSSLAGTLLSLISGFIGQITDLGLAGTYDKIPAVVVSLFVVLLADSVRVFMQYTSNSFTVEKLILNLRARAFKILCQGEIPYLERETHSGDIASRINSDIESFSDLISGTYTWYIRLIFQALAAIVFCLITSWQMSLVYFIVLPITVFIMKKWSKSIQMQQKRASSASGEAISVAVESLRNFETVKSFLLEDSMRNKFAKNIDTATEEKIKSSHEEKKLVAIRYLAVVIQMLALFLSGFLLVYYRIITPGAVIAFIGISSLVRQAAEQSDGILRSYRKGNALLERIYEIFDIPVESGGKDLAPLRGADVVKMDNVSFYYDIDSYVLNNVTLRLGAGQHVGIVGPSGCGKSTIIKIICKFNQQVKGAVELFGIPCHEWSHVSLRRNISLVSQIPYLFDGTIKENVLDGRPDATDEEIIAALKQAQLWNYVESMPQGVHTPIGEAGTEISGGQAQRLSIARAFLKNSDLVLLDEPTSALDTQTENDLQAVLKTLLQGKSALIVSHRYTTLSQADYIYCLSSDGKIIEEGTKEMLLNNKGYFYEMASKQTL